MSKVKLILYKSKDDIIKSVSKTDLLFQIGFNQTCIEKDLVTCKNILGIKNLQSTLLAGMKQKFIIIIDNLYNLKHEVLRLLNYYANKKGVSIEVHMTNLFIDDYYMNKLKRYQVNVINS